MSGIASVNNLFDLVDEELEQASSDSVSVASLPIYGLLEYLGTLLPDTRHSRLCLQAVTTDIQAAYRVSPEFVDLIRKFFVSRIPSYETSSYPCASILSDFGYIARTLKSRGFIKENLFDRPLDPNDPPLFAKPKQDPVLSVPPKPSDLFFFL